MFLLTVLNGYWLNAEEIFLVRTFDTWAGEVIRSTDPAGIVYHHPSGHLFISDSEITEINSIWTCENIFEISLAGDQVFNTHDAFSPGGERCPPLSSSSNREPSGITYNPLDGFFTLPMMLKVRYFGMIIPSGLRSLQCLFPVQMRKESLAIQEPAFFI